MTLMPAEVGSLRKLCVLEAYNNCLGRLPAELALARSLSSLNVSRNKLKRLPAEINSLSALVDLNAADNRLSVMPYIGALQHLRPRPTQPAGFVHYLRTVRFVQCLV